jgi:hypothetical protein
LFSIAAHHPNPKRDPAQHNAEQPGAAGHTSAIRITTACTLPTPNKHARDQTPIEGAGSLQIITLTQKGPCTTYHRTQPRVASPGIGKPHGDWPTSKKHTFCPAHTTSQGTRCSKGTSTHRLKSAVKQEGQHAAGSRTLQVR